MDLGNTYRSKSGNLRFAAAESLSLAAFHFGGSVSQLVQCPSTARSGPTPCALFLMGLALFVETAKTWDYFSIFRLIPAAAQTDWNSVPAGRSPVGAHRFVFQINSSLGAEIAHCAYARMGGRHSSFETDTEPDFTFACARARAAATYAARPDAADAVRPQYRCGRRRRRNS